MRLVILAGLVVLSSPVAHAQVIVADPAVELNTLQSLVREAEAAARRIEMINNQIAQIIQLKATVAAVAHGDLAALSRLAPELAGIGVTVPMGTDMSALANSLTGIGLGAGTTASLAQDLLRTDTLYAPSAGDFRAVAMNQIATAAASQKALGQLMLNSSADRLAALSRLRSGLGDNTDLKASADASARLAGEQAVTQAQTNQLLAAGLIQQAQTATDALREQQAWRCSAEALVAQARASAAVANTGTVTLVSSPSAKSCSTPAASGSTTYVAANTTGTLTLAGGASGDGSTLAKMLAQPWGQAAADNAAALGVNPTALAATCAIESNCSANVGGTGTVSGAFQMTNGTYAQTVSEVQASNPALAATITTKNDPASQSIAAAQYLKDGATSLGNAGIDKPTTLDVRGFYQFGPANGASLAGASDSQLMSTVLTGLSTTTLSANGINGGTTVGQWRQTVTSKIGSAASQPVLGGVRT